MKNYVVTLTCSVALISAYTPSHADTVTVDYVRFLPGAKAIVVRASNPFKPGKITRAEIFDATSSQVLRKIPRQPLLYSPYISSYVVPGLPMKSYNLSGEIVQNFESKEFVTPVAISPDGKYVMGRVSSLMGLWDSSSGKVISRDYLSEPVRFSQNSRGFYANYEGVPTFFKIIQSQGSGILGRFKTFTRVPEVRAFRWAQGDNKDFDVCEKQNLICAVFAPQRTNNPIQKIPTHIVLMNLEGKFLAKLTTKAMPEFGATDVRFSKDGKYLAVRQYEQILICSTKNLKILRRYKPQTFGLRTFMAIDFSPTDNRIAIGGWGRYAPSIIRLP